MRSKDSNREECRPANIPNKINSLAKFLPENRAPKIHKVLSLDRGLSRIKAISIFSSEERKTNKVDSNLDNQLRRVAKVDKDLVEIEILGLEANDREELTGLIKFLRQLKQ